MKPFLLLGLIMILARSCGSGSETQQKPVVSVTILPQKFFVEKLAGSSVGINVMVPPGASPATYEPSVQQLRNLEHSPLYLKIGYVEFELGWMGKIAASNPSMKIVDLSEGVDLSSVEPLAERSRPFKAPAQSATGSPAPAPAHADHSHSGADPHIWMSARNARIIARNTCDALVTLFPEFADSINLHLEQLLKEIDSVDLTISNLLGPYRNGAFMIYHPALTYYARDYHLNQYSLETEGKTPSPKHMQWMVDLGKEENITAIFVQKQFDQRNASVLAGEIGARVIRIDPLSANWSAEMIHIAEQLKASFE